MYDASYEVSASIMKYREVTGLDAGVRLIVELSLEDFTVLNDRFVREQVGPLVEFTTAPLEPGTFRVVVAEPGLNVQAGRFSIVESDGTTPV